MEVFGFMVYSTFPFNTYISCKYILSALQLLTQFISERKSRIYYAHTKHVKIIVLSGHCLMCKHFSSGNAAKYRKTDN